MGTRLPITRLYTSLARFFPSSSRPFTACAALLTALLVFAVPLAALVTEVSASRLLVVTVIAYVLAIYRMDIVFEGVCAAVIVLAVFNVTAAVVVPNTGGHRVRVIDVLLVGTLCWLLVRQQYDSVSSLRKSGRLAVGFFLFFILWTFLAGVVGNGPSSAEAFLYARAQLRYGLLLVIAALLVETTDVRSVLSPLVVALGGALVFAVDEIFSGTSGYPSHFGALGMELQRIWPTPSLTSFPVDSTILYVGPPVGQNRIMVGMAIFFVPLVVATVARSRLHPAFSVAGVLGVVSVFASTADSAYIALCVAIAIVAVYWCYVVLGRYGLSRAQSLFLPLSMLVGVIAILWGIGAIAAGREQILFVQTNHLGVRLREYTVAVDVAARYPLFGVGGGENFEQLMDRRWGVHNLFLANLVATGVPGFLAYVIGVIGATWLCVERLLRSGLDERWIWVGVFAAMLGFYAYAFWTIAFQRETMNAIYWILVGTTIGASWGDR